MKRKFTNRPYRPKGVPAARRKFAYRPYVPPHKRVSKTNKIFLFNPERVEDASIKKKKKYSDRPYRPKNSPPIRKRKFAVRPYRPRSSKVLQIVPSAPENASFGSGFIISEQGHVITNKHVTEKSDSIRLILGEHVFNAVLIEEDDANDLAILKINGRFSPIPIGDSNKIRLGSGAHTVGYPNPVEQGRKPKYTQGTVSSTHGPRDDVRRFQISTPIQPGNSGGPVFDDYGNVIGIVVSKLREGDLVGYAIKSAYIFELIHRVGLKKSGLPVPHSTIRRIDTEIIPEILHGTVQVVAANKTLTTS